MNELAGNTLELFKRCAETMQVILYIVYVVLDIRDVYDLIVRNKIYFILLSNTSIKWQIL